MELQRKSVLNVVRLCSVFPAFLHNSPRDWPRDVTWFYFTCSARLSTVCDKLFAQLCEMPQLYVNVKGVVYMIRNWHPTDGGGGVDLEYRQCLSIPTTERI